MKKLALLTLLILGLTAAATADLPRIAVYVTGSVPDNEKKALGTRMLASLVNSGRYKGIERSESFLAEIDREHVKQRSGAIDDSQISELGKQFGVRYVCIADITPAYNAYQVSARIINVETAEVSHIGEAFSSLKTARDLKETSDQVVKNMFGDPTSFWATKPTTPFSVGGGLSIALKSGGGIMWTDTPTERIEMPYTGIGGHIYFDAKYALAAVSFDAGSKKWSSGNVGRPENLPDMQRMSVTAGLFAKYPLTLGESQKITLFPLAGGEYEMALSAKLVRANGTEYNFHGEDGRPKANDLSALWVKAGVGADISLNHRIYVRAEGTYGMRDANKFEKDMAKAEKEERGYSAEAKVGAGMFLKIGAGFRF